MRVHSSAIPHGCGLRFPFVNQSEQTAFDAPVAELDAALAGLHEPPVRDNSAFAIEPSWYPEILCVTADRGGAADLLFVPEGDWIRVDIAGLDECLALPLPGNLSRAARKEPSVGETLTRLLTSKATVIYGHRRTELFLTDLEGSTWCRNKYRRARMPPPGIAWGESREFLALCPTPP